MQFRVTNNSYAKVSLPNGQVIDLGLYKDVFISDEAFYLVLTNGIYPDCSKDLLPDVGLCSALVELQAAGAIVVQNRGSFGSIGNSSWFLSALSATYTMNSFPDVINESKNDLVLFNATKASTIISAGFSVVASGSDNNNPLSMSLDVKINGASIFITCPVIEQNANAAANTFVAASNVTMGVINMSNHWMAIGDVVTFDLAVTRLHPFQEMTGAVVTLELM